MATVLDRPLESPTTTSTPPLFEHQKQTVALYEAEPRTIDGSDPGVGKTLCVIEWMRRAKDEGPFLILAPLSILVPSWGTDLVKFAPDLSFQICTAQHRERSFNQPADVYITNVDAARWLVKHPEIYKRFNGIVGDEITSFKSVTSQRSKALAAIIKEAQPKYVRVMSGTLTPNSTLDLWHPVFLVDGGERLGQSYYAFRHAVCEPRQVGRSPHAVKWTDKPGAIETVVDLISDISIRHKFEDCTDIPPNRVRTMPFDLNPKHLQRYEQLARDSLIELENNQAITAVHAGALANKLLQMASGAVYDENGEAHELTTQRHELVIQLVKEREHSLVAFNWRHQKDALCRLADKEGLSYAVIDGSVSSGDRAAAVQRFQAGELQAIFAHPQAASHGLTLTKGTTCIWSSPTYNAEHFLQFNHRIYRTSQTKPTETILISANNTLDETVYEQLQGKLDRVDTVNGLFEALTGGPH